jgi:cytochrome c2
MTRRALSLALLLVVSLMLWSCGTGDNDDSPETSTSGNDVAQANVPTLSGLAATLTPAPADTPTPTPTLDPATSATQEADASAPEGGDGNQPTGTSGDPAAIERGKSLAQQCMACHSVDGSTLIGPTWQGLYGRTVTLDDGSTVTADAAYITQSILDPGSQVVDGFPPSMPPFTSLSDQDIADIIAYIESLAD